MNRRDFLKSLLIAAVGAPIAAKITPPKAPVTIWGSPVQLGNYIEVADFSGETIDYAMEIVLQNYRFVMLESGYYKKHGEMEIIKKIFHSDEYGWDHYTIGWKCMARLNLELAGRFIENNK